MRLIEVELFKEKPKAKRENYIKEKSLEHWTNSYKQLAVKLYFKNKR